MAGLPEKSAFVHREKPGKKIYGIIFGVKNAEND